MESFKKSIGRNNSYVIAKVQGGNGIFMIV